MEPSESAEQMLDSRGTYLYTFGAGYHGQLGRRFGHSKKKYCMVPKLVELPEPVRWVACGGLHTAAVSGETASFRDAQCTASWCGQTLGQCILGVTGEVSSSVTSLKVPIAAEANCVT